MIFQATLLFFLLAYYYGFVVALAALERQALGEEGSVSIMWQWLPAAFWWGVALGTDQLMPYTGTVIIGAGHLLLTVNAVRRIRALRSN